ncbi:MAG: hypothetical protein ABSG95_12585 [Solirubrobacteraceae bacterium]|jgi:hypothetical protein
MLLLALVDLSGCNGRSTASTSPPLGRSLGAESTVASQAPAPAGDPPEERNGTVPNGRGVAQNEPKPSAIAPSAQAALTRYALAYTNWQATSLVAHERELASLAIGAARLAAEQTAASHSAATQLGANHVENKGVVLAIGAGQGPAHGEWVVVTQEQTSGTGPFAGLPPAPHVTLARTARVGSGWAVSEWSPQT